MRAKALFNILLIATGSLLGYVSALLMAASIIDEADVVTITEAVTTRPHDELALETCSTEANVTQIVMETTSGPTKTPTSTTTLTQRLPQTLTTTTPQMPTLMLTIGDPKTVTGISDKERLLNLFEQKPSTPLMGPTQRNMSRKHHPWLQNQKG